MEEIAAKQARGKPIEIWFQDEARVGQKNKITRRWAKRGTRPSAPRDQRTASAYIFGAICPAEGKGAGLVLPSCNSEAMALHLAEISLAVAPGAHALVLLDQAGWHVSKKLTVPGNMTLVPLPPKSPELNPVENIWQFIRDNWLSKPDLQILSRHPRSLLLRLEQAHRYAMENYVHRDMAFGNITKRILSSHRFAIFATFFPKPLGGGSRAGGGRYEARPAIRVDEGPAPRPSIRPTSSGCRPIGSHRGFRTTKTPK